MEKRELICIVCPKGCKLEVKIKEEGEILVSGNHCLRGEEYGRKEVTSPTRVVTTTIKINNRKKGQIPCKTKGEVPKDKVWDVIQEIKNLRIDAPVFIGEVLVENIAQTGVALIATWTLE